MAISLYDFSVGTYQQVVGATAGFLKKGAAHCNDNGIPLEDVVACRLYPDMANFHFQVVCVAHHSIAAIRGIESGEFGPPRDYPDTDYAGLQQLIDRTLDELNALDEGAVNALSDGKVTFKLGDTEIPFTNQNFIRTFSLPNLYFHATTAYDILRMQGVPLGKRDFLGAMKIGA